MIRRQFIASAYYQKLMVIFVAIFFAASIYSSAQPLSKSRLSPDQYQNLLRSYFDEDGPGASIIVEGKGNFSKIKLMMEGQIIEGTKK